MGSYVLLGQSDADLVSQFVSWSCIGATFHHEANASTYERSISKRVRKSPKSEVSGRHNANNSFSWRRQSKSQSEWVSGQIGSLPSWG